MTKTGIRCVPNKAFNQKGWDGASSRNFFIIHFVAKTFEYSHNILKTLTRSRVLCYSVVVVLVGPIYDAPAIVGVKSRTLDVSFILLVPSILQAWNNISSNSIGVFLDRKSTRLNSSHT